MARIKVFDKSTKKWIYADNSFGKTGPKGDKPVKGVDYWTEADKEEIIQQVITALGTPVFGRVDAENNIILTGELVDGTYMLKYEDADGAKTVIGTIVVGAATIINQIPKSIDKNGDIYGEDYNSDGVKDGYKVNTRVSANKEQNYDGVTTTGYIPVKANDVLYLKNITMPKGDNKYFCRMVGVTEPNAEEQWSIEGSDVAATGDQMYFTYDENGNVTSFTVPTSGNIHYIRVNAAYIGADSIVSINQPIE